MAEEMAEKQDMPQVSEEKASESLPEEPEEKVPEDRLKLVLDIPLEIRVELGRNRMIIKELLQLGQGSVIELNKTAGEPLDIYVNDRLIARGETVVVNEKYGIRITDIISPLERIKSLGE